MFDCYQDPIKARRVWQEYYPDIMAKSIEFLDRAESIAETCQTSEELDFKLDRLVGKPPIHLFDDFYNLDSPGENPDGFSSSWSRAVKNYEEGVV